MSNNSIKLQWGDFVGPYRIEVELGRGNNGVVYLARQELMDRLVACKILFPEEGENEENVDAFFREARTAAKMSHPNIVQALDVGIDGEMRYFIMEYVDGEMLEYIRVATPELLTPKFILSTAIKLANALDYAWRNHGIVHGDIKPENILINVNDGSPKLADLGVARIAGSSNDTEIMATPLYVAPEVITQTGISPDPRSDIYSFGVMLYELCCGEPPFDGEMDELLNKHIYELPCPLLRKNPDMDIKFADLIDRMLAKSPDHRPQSWHEVECLLREIENKMLAAPQKQEKLVRPQTPSGTSSWLKLTICIIAGIALALLVIMLLRFV